MIEPKILNLNDWDLVDRYNDNGTMVYSPTYLEKVSSGDYPRDAFSKGQLASKKWLIEELQNLDNHDFENIAILGCWIGAAVDSLLKILNTKRIYGIDLDPYAIELADKLNQHHVQNSWKFKGVVSDVSMLDTSAMTIQIGGELIEVHPNMVINTSCEHMNDDWFHSAATDQLLVIQTNNFKEWHEHVNCVHSIEAMQEKYPLTTTLYVGELITPKYSRYMIIGYK